MFHFVPGTLGESVVPDRPGRTWTWHCSMSGLTRARRKTGSSLPILMPSCPRTNFRICSSKNDLSNMSPYYTILPHGGKAKMHQNAIQELTENTVPPFLVPDLKWWIQKTTPSRATMGLSQDLCSVCSVWWSYSWDLLYVTSFHLFPPLSTSFHLFPPLSTSFPCDIEHLPQKKTKKKKTTTRALIFLDAFIWMSGGKCHPVPGCRLFSEVPAHKASREDPSWRPHPPSSCPGGQNQWWKPNLQT